MAEHSTIEWTDATWNPITGCSVVSPGCTNCYAMKLAGTRLKHHPSRSGLTIDTKAGPVWNGTVRLNERALDEPLRWKRPRMIFCCAHGDLFHESVPDEWIDEVFAIMALCPHHTFQVLTKRAARMRAYLTDPGVVRRVYEIVCDLTLDNEINVVLIAPGVDEQFAPAAPRIYLDVWPLQNIWLGVSVEDQARADQRVPDLLATPAAIRFVSSEPLLGQIDFTRIKLPGIIDPLNAFVGETWTKIEHGKYAGQIINSGNLTGLGKLDWVIAGGESGPGARPMHPDWARGLRDQCQSAGVPFFFKQWGAWAPADTSRRRDWMLLSADGDLDIPDDRWPIDEMGEVAVINIGKKAAGRLLEGVEHNGMPGSWERPAS